MLYESVRKLPQVDFVYFADNFCVPYGSLPKETLINKVDGFFKQINDLNPAAAVIACNTVTAQCADFLRAKYSFPIIGIQPAVKPAALSGGKSAVLLTPATAASEPVRALVERYGNGETEVLPCADLAAYIENNIFNLNKKEVFRRLPATKAENIVLGCTHYFYIKDIIKEYYGCRIFDGNEGTLRQICKILGNFDHHFKKGSKIAFSGGDAAKNAEVFKMLVAQSGL